MAQAHLHNPNIPNINRPIEMGDTPVPTRFLSLPVELRVEVYQHLLRCSYPIEEKKIDKRDSPAVQLLRTCKQIHQEGNEVFYGENEFRFCGLNHSYFHVLRSLNKTAFDWLKELTITIPIAHRGSMNLDPRALEDHTFLPHDGKVVSSASARADFSGNKLVKDLLDAVAYAPALTKLNLVIPHDWRPLKGKYFHGKRVFYFSPWDLEVYLHRPDVWQDLAILVEQKPSLKITVTRLNSGVVDQDVLRAQQRLVTKLIHRLGVWDCGRVPYTYGTRQWARAAKDAELDPNPPWGLPLLFGNV